MKIQVGGLSDGVYRYTFLGRAEELNLGASYRGEVRVAATVEKAGSQVHLTVTASGEGSFECDRCVGSFEQSLEGRYTMHYLLDPEEAARFEPSEVQIVSPGFSVIDLADDVRQTLLLAVPLKLLCREECAGLCPRCGRNLNEGPCGCTEELVDSRWEQLRRLRGN